MADPVANFAFGTLDSTGMTSVATSFNFRTGDGARFPSTSGGSYNVVIYDKLYGSPAVAYWAGKAEILRINTLSGDAVSSCTRAQEGTTALDFNNPLKQYRVERTLTAKDFTDLSGFGSHTYFGTGAPSQTFNDGDFYYETTNTPYVEYVQNNNAWVQVSS